MKNYKEYIENIAESHDEIFNQESTIETEEDKPELEAFLKTLNEKYT